MNHKFDCFTASMLLQKIPKIKMNFQINSFTSLYQYRFADLKFLKYNSEQTGKKKFFSFVSIQFCNSKKMRNSK